MLNFVGNRYRTVDQRTFALMCAWLGVLIGIESHRNASVSLPIQIAVGIFVIAAGLKHKGVSHG